MLFSYESQILKIFTIRNMWGAMVVLSIVFVYEMIFSFESQLLKKIIIRNMFKTVVDLSIVFLYEMLFSYVSQLLETFTIRNTFNTMVDLSIVSVYEMKTEFGLLLFIFSPKKVESLFKVIGDCVDIFVIAKIKLIFYQ